MFPLRWLFTHTRPGRVPPTTFRNRRYPAERGEPNPPRTEAAPGKHRRWGGKEGPEERGGHPGLAAPLPRGRARQTKMLAEEMGLFCLTSPPPSRPSRGAPGLPPSLPAGGPSGAGSAAPQPAHGRLGLGAAPEERARPRRPRRCEGPPSGPYRAAGQAPPQREDSRPSGPGPAPPAAAAAASTSVVAGEGPAEAG